MFVEAGGLRTRKLQPSAASCKDTYCKAIKNLVTLGLGGLLENLEVFEHLNVYLDFVIKSDAIFPQEVKDDCVGRL